MKRLSLVLALIVVLTLGTVVFASNADTEKATAHNGWQLVNHLGESKDIDVNLTVDKFAQIYLSGDSLDLTLTNPGTQGESFKSNGVGYEVATNTWVTVTFTEKIGPALSEQGISSDTIVFALQGFKDGKWSNVGATWSADGSTWTETLAGGQKYDGQIRLAATWRFTKDSNLKNDPFWDELPWWKLTDGLHTGVVSVTVEALTVE